jgi:hypothetical protein
VCSPAIPRIAHDNLFCRKCHQKSRNHMREKRASFFQVEDSIALLEEASFNRLLPTVLCCFSPQKMRTKLGRRHFFWLTLLFGWGCLVLMHGLDRAIQLVTLAIWLSPVQLLHLISSGPCSLHLRVAHLSTNATGLNSTSG